MPGGALKVLPVVDMALSYYGNFRAVFKYTSWATTEGKSLHNIIFPMKANLSIIVFNYLALGVQNELITVRGVQKREVRRPEFLQDVWKGVPSGSYRMHRNTVAKSSAEYSVINTTSNCIKRDYSFETWL
jgi:hypothetical protein